MSHFPPELKKLINYLKKLPGVGGKTAERFAFELLEWPDLELAHIGKILSHLKENVVNCTTCHCLMSSDSCTFCDPELRDSGQLCIIANARDVYAIEETRFFKGLYHALGGLLSPISGLAPSDLNLTGLKARIESRGVKEVIIALDSTLEGDSTSLYLKEELEIWGVKATRLAFGLPMGSSLDYVDGGTLIRALEGRQSL